MNDSGCSFCRTPKYPFGRPFCARCRPAEFAAEVKRIKLQIRVTGELRFTDELPPYRACILPVPVPAPPPPPSPVRSLFL